MGNKYVRKEAAAKVAPPSARGPAPHNRTATGGQAAAAGAAAAAEDPIEDPLAIQRAALQEKQDELEAQEQQQQLQQQQLDVRTVARPQGEEQLQHRSGSVQASVQASDFGPSEVLVSDE